MDSLPIELDEHSIIDLILSEKEEEPKYKPNLLQKLKLNIFGRAMVGKYEDENWSGSLTLYIFKCPEHGTQLSYPMGWKKKLICIKCLEKT